MLYYYFKTKDELFFAVVDETYDVLLEGLATALGADVPVCERLRRLFARVDALSEDELMMARLVAGELLNASPRVDRLIERFKRGHVALALELVTDGIAAGVFRHDLPLPAIFVSLMALVFPAQVLLRAAGERFPLPVSRADVPTALQAILLHGIGASTARDAPR